MKHASMRAQMAGTACKGERQGRRGNSAALSGEKVRGSESALEASGVLADDDRTG